MRGAIAGKIVDVIEGEIFDGSIHYDEGVIKEIRREESAPDRYILPGLVDAHVHIESSMLVPSEFARLAVLHGTVATVSDPHEIGNVLGVEGVRYMIENGKSVPFSFNFGAPSCVPATAFETAGAEIDLADVKELLADPDIHFLSEMMNYPGVISRDPLVMDKIAAAHAVGKPVDGHAPGVRGSDLDAYLSAGIATDHESYSYEEGKEKLQKGMKLLIREGSAAKNFDALIPLLEEFPDEIFFCSDDKHPDDLIEGHLNLLLARAVAKGHNPMDTIRAVTRNPVEFYKLDSGLLRVGDPASFCVMDNLREFNCLATYYRGECVAKEGACLFEAPPAKAINRFVCDPITPDDLKIESPGKQARVIEAIDGEIITKECFGDPQDKAADILKIAVLNRYQPANPAVALVKGFGLTQGAIASSVAHDSHNIIAVGVDDHSLATAINHLVESKGGIVAVDEGGAELLSLPIAGLMTNEEGASVGRRYSELNEKVREMGGALNAPFMTLSFLALLVIPTLKLSDKGLFDGRSFTFTSLSPEGSQIAE